MIENIEWLSAEDRKKIFEDCSLKKTSATFLDWIEWIDVALTDAD